MAGAIHLRAGGGAIRAHAGSGLAAFGAPLQARLLRQYGLPMPDRARLHFHALLDALF
jgi:hypothetical protein